MNNDFLFTDEYLDYLEHLPADDRESVLKQHIKEYNLVNDNNIKMSDIELYAILKDRDFDKLKGKID